MGGGVSWFSGNGWEPLRLGVGMVGYFLGFRIGVFCSFYCFILFISPFLLFPLGNSCATLLLDWSRRWLYEDLSLGIIYVLYSFRELLCFEICCLLASCLSFSFLMRETNDLSFNLARRSRDSEAGDCCLVDGEWGEWFFLFLVFQHCGESFWAVEVWSF